MNAGARGDLREGGAWTFGQSLKNDAIVVLVRAALALLRPFPPAALRALGRFAGVFAYVLFGGARRTADANVAIALPDLDARERRALVRTSYTTLGAHLGDALSALRADRCPEPLPIDDDSLALLTRTDRGVLFASAHLGPWERVAASLVARGVRLTAVTREPYDPRLATVYDRLRGGRVPHIPRGAPGAAARIVRALRAGCVLGVPMDLRSRVPSVLAPFLGRPALTPVGPARIALRTGAAVVVGTVAPDPARPGGLRVTCTEVPTSDLAPGEDGERVLTLRINDALSARILALPAEWVWMHDRFAEGDPVH